MSEYKALTEFYPTPPELIAKMLDGIRLKRDSYVLEPSAGKGDIVEFIACVEDRTGDSWRWRTWDPNNIMSTEEVIRKITQDVVEDFKNNKRTHYTNFYKNIDCIEIDPTLQAVLKGKNFNVIDSDFLKYDGDKHYDYIIMNPPFSDGDEHLLHALNIAEKTGSQIVCLLNAETIKNPYSNARKELLKRLKKYEATYEFIENAFVNSERPTDVEVVIVRVTVPSPFKNYSRIWEELEEENIELNAPEGSQELVTNDLIEQAVLMYKREIKAGQRLIEEYLALKPHFSSRFENEDTPDYAKGSTLILTTDQKRGNLDWNEYVYSVRYKYWYELLHKPSFLGNLTSNLRDEYFQNIREFAKKDFSVSNIYAVKIDILKNTAKGIEDKIVSLFEKLSYEHSLGCEGNIHYFTGWKSNSAFAINKKVVVPYMSCWDYIWKKFKYEYELGGFLTDIEKCLDFLDGGETEFGRDIRMWLRHYEENQETKNLHFKYFDINVYKKGTIHIKFTNLDVLKKLNIYGCMRRGWLPPSYGKKSYADMDAEEKAVIDDFEGEESYSEVFENHDRFIVEPEKQLLLSA